jgi:TyrR family helix-turn-helix protein
MVLLMRLVVESKDRIGISQEILSVFSLRDWDIVAIEAVRGFTYVHIKDDEFSIKNVDDVLKNIRGVITCKEVELLPTERREKHLQALLDRIPDPIIDIDEHGVILATNQSSLLLSESTPLEGKHIGNFIEHDYKAFLVDKAFSCDVTFLKQSFVADITPVFAHGSSLEKKISGAVIILKTMKALGRQISLIQTRQEQGVENIIGQSAKMRILIEQTLRYAELELPVMISGETGTGKELIARALHTASSRAKAPFLAINCAALSEHLLESELFGYASGAFTGAQKGGKPGLFELANGGTIFLDEIAEMSTYLQAKLLRFLQDFKYRRVGGTTELQANVRVISASHQNLLSLLEKKQFREDLFYRLNVLSLHLPPLRERAEDIPLLSDYFVTNAAVQVNQPVPLISPKALEELIAFPWPGNIRQLQNILFRVVALNQGVGISPFDIKNALSQFGIKPTNDRSIDREVNVENGIKEPVQVLNEQNIVNWSEAQADFERKLLTTLFPLYPTTRKLAQRLKVSHNKIALKLKQHKIRT